MDWRVLGPLEVSANGSPVNLGGRQRRLVLAILLANANQTVSTDRLIEEVWSGSPPDSARKTIQAHVAHLRGALNGDSEFLSPSDDGYLLSPEAMTVDADRFESAVVEARNSHSTDQPGVADRLDEALAMFRGEPYAGLADDALTVKIEAARLDELRLTAREDRLDALLAAGDTARVAADVERVLAEHPLRERLWAIQMLALYRSGRQSEALNSFSRARQILAEELGIEPSSELQTLEQQILEQDSVLLDSSRGTTGGSRAHEVRRNPYKGLRAFDEADANDFYGRGELIRQLVDRLTTRPPAPLTVVAGPSGAGKSSVVRAGVIPLLRDRGLMVAVLFPGDDPGSALDLARREALPEMGGEVDGSRVDVVIVDQFEEIFTSTPQDEADRLITQIIDATDPTLWVLTVRADFLEEMLAHPELGRRLQESLVLVPPLEDHEVEVAIVEPARHVGVDVEPSLVATVVREVGARASALPLMQYALTDLFDRRRDDLLTLDAYQREGGLSGALVRRADQVLQRLSPQGRDAARQIFLQLVTIADNGEFARRRVQRDGLETREPALTDQILEEFGAQRLLTFDQDPTSGRATVELAHESLLQVWPLLARWVDEAQEQLLMRSALNTALAEWEANGRDESFLLSGGRLAQHETWTADTDLALTSSETEFLSESRRHAELARGRRRRRRNWITAGFGLAAAAMMLVVVVAVQQAASAEEAERIAKALDLAAAASSQLQLDPQASLLIAIEAVELTRRVDGTVLTVAEEALHRAVLADPLLGVLSHKSDGIAHFSPDGELLVSSSENWATPQVWSVDPFEKKLDLVGHTTRVIDAVFDPAGDRIATTSEDGTVRIWDLATGESIVVHDFGAQRSPLTPVFSNDGSMLAATRGPDEVWVWDLDSGDLLWSSSAPPGNYVLNLEFSPDDSLLAVSQDDGATDRELGALLFDVGTGDLVGTIGSHASGVLDVGFTPDGSRIVTAGIDATVQISDMDTGEVVGVFSEHQGPVVDIQISEDGTTVASGGEVDVKVWDLATLEVISEVFGHSGPVEGIDLSPDNDLLLTSSASDQTTRLWDLSPPSSHELIGLPGPTGQPGVLAYSPNGSQLAAARGSGLITFWDPLSGTELRTIDAGGAVYGLAFDAEGELLASAGEGVVVLRDLGSGEETILWSDSAEDVAFSRDGSVAVAVWEGVRLWERPLDGDSRLISRPDGIEATSVVAFAPDGEVFAMGDESGGGIHIFTVEGSLVKELYPPPPAPPPPRISSIAFHHDRDLLVTADTDAIAVLWSAKTFERLHELKGHTAGIQDAVFHPTLPELATGGDDATVKIWDIDTGLLRMSIPAPGPVSDLAYSPDGRYLAATGEGFVTVYMLDLDELVSEAESRLTRWWTETECSQYLDSDTCPAPPEHLTE